MRAKIELVDLAAVEKFVSIAKSIEADVRLVGKDENGSDWNISAKSLLASLVISQREQINRAHTAHEVDWNTIWCVCDEDIYMRIEEFVVA